jgi:hypothetical protein
MTRGARVIGGEWFSPVRVVYSAEDQAHYLAYSDNSFLMALVSRSM